MSATYIAYIGEAEQGPYTFEDLEMCESVGDITPETYVRISTHDIWKHWTDVKSERAALVERKRLYEASRPGAPAVRPPTPGFNLAAPAIAPLRAAKPRIAYVLLGLFFGCFGVHNFYAGYTTKGILQILITVALGWVFFLGAMITGIWAIIEMITVTQDAEGVPFS